MLSGRGWCVDIWLMGMSLLLLDPLLSAWWMWMSIERLDVVRMGGVLWTRLVQISSSASEMRCSYLSPLFDNLYYHTQPLSSRHLDKRWCLYASS